MTTDTQRPFKKDPGEPDRCLAFPFHRLNLPKARLDEISTECRKANLGCVDCKKMLAEALIENLAPIQERRRYYEAHPDEVLDVMRQGNDRARQQARQTMAEVREALGFNRKFQLGPFPPLTSSKR
jgi:tryptophanyl-tRNA synthetase